MRTTIRGPGVGLVAFTAGTGGGGGGGDPDFSSVVSLLHFDGADGSTTFTDVKGKTWTVNSSAQIDTAQFQFGGASGLFDGADDYVQTASSSDFTFGTGDFTIECWVRPNSITSTRQIVGRHVTNSDNVGNIAFIFLATSGALAFTAFTSPSTSVTVTDPGAMSTATWYHTAAVRDGTSLRLYRGGVQVASAVIGASSVQASSLPVTVGHAMRTAGVEPGLGWNGHIDDMRITKGVCRYPGGTTFTPPAYPFSEF